MSDYFDARVLNRGATWIDLVLRVCHPDAPRMSESRGFALRTLLGLVHESEHSSELDTPLANELDMEDACDPEACAEEADDYIASVRVYRATNLPFSEEALQQHCDAVAASKGFAPGSDGFVQAQREARESWWASVDGPPHYFVRIEVTDACWIATMEPGMKWRFAASCYDGPWVTENRDEPIDVPTDAVVPPQLVDFRFALRPRRDSDIDHLGTRSLLSSTAGLASDALEQALAAHRAFLESGGRDGNWSRFSADGMALCVYDAKGADGQQLVLRMKKLAPGAVLTQRDLSFADLSTSICSEARFTKAKLERSVALGAVFDNADFSGSCLREIDFTGSSLRGASFRDADLRGADFENCDCSGADFRGARLDGSSFQGAILDGVQR